MRGGLRGQETRETKGPPGGPATPGACSAWETSPVASGKDVSSRTWSLVLLGSGPAGAKPAGHSWGIWGRLVLAGGIGTSSHVREVSFGGSCKISAPLNAPCTHGYALLPLVKTSFIPRASSDAGGPGTAYGFTNSLLEGARNLVPF